MRHKSHNMLKGVGIGVVAGCALGLAGHNLMNNKAIKRKFGKAAGAVTDFVGNVQQYMHK